MLKENENQTPFAFQVIFSLMPRSLSVLTFWCTGVPLRLGLRSSVHLFLLLTQI